MNVLMTLSLHPVPVPLVVVSVSPSTPLRVTGAWDLQGTYVGRLGFWQIIYSLWASSLSIVLRANMAIC